MLIHTLLPAEIQCKRREKKYLMNYKKTGWIEGGGEAGGKRNKIKKIKKNQYNVSL